ncbi:MAG: hypothetical protein JXA96_16750 [Sedimentisphaerales bacterium]|nr:hypothetical protein [Sedimentisphaerales bacterium]
MTDIKQAENSNKEQKSILTNTLAISIIILIAAIGIGMVIRGIRNSSSEISSVDQVNEEQELDTPDELPEVVYTIPPVIEEEPEPVREVVIESDPEPEPEPEPVYEEPVQNERTYTLTEQQRQDAAQWISWLGTLTQEERTQLFRGSIMAFMQTMQRWQYMPPEQVMEERTFLRELIQGWRDLPPEERQQGIENIQNQLQQWLQSGQQY